MTGFKSGASDDGPLDDDTDRTTESDMSGHEPRNTSDPAVSGGSDPATVQSGLPWIYSRNGITDGRAKTVQLHLQDTTLDSEQAARSDPLIDESVSKADLREAAYIVGLQHLDDIAATLREWGYDAE
ncbi:hypothetical protein [Haloarcula montana]|uniref:hypothetical protein n=1 Tax=Haloarcula montana TaxID=3111776 RepID=UPI002D77F536|nr:hypothetical protein [Haloarcula sp. GH36]